MSQESAQRYTYKPLNEHKDLRLLCLAAGDDEAEIFAALQPVAFQDPDLPAFTALSYTWGPGSRDASIYVDSASFAVTANLLAALKHLRKADSDRRVWVDAICINQADHLEKSLQVPKIHLIYRAAGSCLAWLGLPSDDSELGMKTLGHLTHCLDCVEQCRKENHPSTQSWNAARKLLSRDYWRRTWILQELIWATDIYFSCSGVDVDYNQFVQAKDHLLLHTQNQPQNYATFTLQLIRDIKAQLFAQTINLSEDRKAEPLVDLMTAKVGHQATDPRDHVYAILNLLPRSEWPAEPDYTRTVVEVFAQATIKIITLMKSLEILRLCNAAKMGVDVPPGVPLCGAEKIGERGRFGAILPTWVPNWMYVFLRPSQKRFGSYHNSKRNLYSCDADLVPRLQILGPAHFPSLLTNTILYDSIRTCSRYTFWQNTLDKTDLQGLIHLASDQAVPDSDVHKSSECEDALWRSLMLDCGSSDSAYRATSADVQDFAARMQTTANLTSREYGDLVGRKLFVTAKGLLGIGPDCSQQGDKIAIIPGCSVPMVLRDSRNDMSFNIMGEACKLTSQLVIRYMYMAS